MTTHEEDIDQSHEVPPDLLELHEVLEWEDAVRKETVRNAVEDAD